MNIQRGLKYLALFILLTISQWSNALMAQDMVDNVSKKNAISFSVAGTTPFIGISYERLISQRVSAEIGLGALSIGIGAKFFPWPISDNKMVLHTGFSINIFSTPLDTFGDGDFSSISYIMLGLTYYGSEGFNFSIDIGPSYNYDFTFKESSFPVYGNLKLGYRF